MNKPDKKVTVLIIALIVSVLAFGAIVLFLASSLFLPRVRNVDQNDDQNGNALKIPALLQDQNGMMGQFRVS